MSVEPSSTEDEQLAGGIDADLDANEAADEREIFIDGITIEGNEQSKVARRNGDGSGGREDGKERGTFYPGRQKPPRKRAFGICREWRPSGANSRSAARGKGSSFAGTGTWPIRRGPGKCVYYYEYSLKCRTNTSETAGPCPIRTRRAVRLPAAATAPD
jgi:hypothetical protein